MAIQTFDLDIVPRFRSGNAILDDGVEGRELTLRELIVRGLDQSDLRPINPQTGQPAGTESVGSIRKRIALADRLEGGEGHIQLESEDVAMLERAIPSAFAPPVAAMVIAAFDKAKIEPENA